MRPFEYQRVSTVAAAVDAARARDAQYLAGGTVMLDLMKLDTLRPARLVDIQDLRAGLDYIEARPDGLRLGALTHMQAVADHPQVNRDYPLIALTMKLAASPQLVGSSRVDLQACKLEYSIVSPK